MKLLLGVTACVATLALAASPASAQDFCGGVRKVAASVPLNFEGVRHGGEDDLPMLGDSKTPDYFLPGAVPFAYKTGSKLAPQDGSPEPPCEILIYQDFSSGAPVMKGWSYACNFNGGQDPYAAAGALSAAVADCMGQPHPQLADNRGRKVYTVSVSGVEYDVSPALNADEAAQPYVTLEISPAN